MKELNLSYPPLWEEPLTLYQNLADVNSAGAQDQGNYYSFPCRIRSVFKSLQHSMVTEPASSRKTTRIENY